jgi:hypothetical protein
MVTAPTAPPHTYGLAGPVAAGPSHPRERRGRVRTYSRPANKLRRRCAARLCHAPHDGTKPSSTPNR